MIAYNSGVRYIFILSLPTRKKLEKDQEINVKVYLNGGLENPHIILNDGEKIYV